MCAKLSVYQIMMDLMALGTTAHAQNAGELQDAGRIRTTSDCERWLAGDLSRCDSHGE
jgi:hypothetical protein